jgi:hypothetical protein
VSESNLRNRFRDPHLFPETSVIFIEKRRDTPDGQPDIAVRYGRFFVPIELKESDTPINDMRPAQKKWFRLNYIAGGFALLANTFETKSNDIVAFRQLDQRLNEVNSSYCKTSELNYDKVIHIIQELLIPVDKNICFLNGLER